MPSLRFDVDGIKGAVFLTGSALDTLVGINGVGLLDHAGDGVDGAVPGALGAALAERGIDDVPAQSGTLLGTAPLIHNVLDVLVPEGGQSGQNRQRGGLAQTAQCHALDHLRQFFQRIDVLQLALTVDDPLQNLQHPLGAFPAGGALAAGFPLGEAHEEPGDFHHAGVLPHDHHAAGADDGVVFLHGVKVQRNVQMFFRQTAAGGAADLHGLEFRAVLQSAAHVEDDLTQGRTHGNFDQAGVFNGAGEGEGLAAGAARECRWT